MHYEARSGTLLSGEKEVTSFVGTGRLFSNSVTLLAPSDTLPLKGIAGQQ